MEKKTKKLNCGKKRCTRGQEIDHLHTEDIEQFIKNNPGSTINKVAEMLNSSYDNVLHHISRSQLLIRKKVFISANVRSVYYFKEDDKNIQLVDL